MYKKPHIVWFQLYEMSRIDNSIGTGSGLVAARVWGEGKGDVIANGQGFFWGDDCTTL